VYDILNSGYDDDVVRGAKQRGQRMKREPRKREPNMEKLVAVFTMSAALIGTAISTIINSAA
jgi:hypothetical protein